MARKYDHDLICDMYRSGKSIPQICKEIGCTSGSVIPALRKHGIATRSISDAVSMSRLGAKSKQTHGYVFVRTGKYRRALEHRLVMEKELGRKLLDDEVVHHKDGNTDNNSPDNLIVITRGEHTRLHHKNKSPDLTDKQKMLVTLYLEGKSPLEIRTALGIKSQSFLYAALKKAGIEPRTSRRNKQ